MITERDLQEAIAECQGVKNPNANTCIKLASFYIIRDHLYPQEGQELPQYSYDTEPSMVNANAIRYYSETEFGQAVSGKDVEDIMTLMDEVMSVVQVINPKLYESIMERI